MQFERLTPVGVIVRFLTALLLVYATFNPEGVSYFHWAIMPLIRGEGIGSIGPIQVVAGILLLIGWFGLSPGHAAFAGTLGALLVLALGAALIWLLVDWHVLRTPQQPRLRARCARDHQPRPGHRLSWSSVDRRITGQLDTYDQVG